MSGIDECLREIPECPRCGKRPNYWTINTIKGPTLWLFSEEYRHQREEMYGSNPEMRGEGHYKVLTGAFKFIKGTCMGGCGKEVRVDDYPDTLNLFFKMFEMYFPSKIQRTD